MSGNALGSIARIGLMAVGYYFGGPIGATVAGIAGNLLFPQKLPGVSGPRLGDQQFTASTEGQAIALVYGKHVVYGNFLWAAPLDEVENSESSGGKGGPSQEVTTYTYFLSFAIALCEGPITGVSRIWENGKPIYDRRSQQEGESETAYTKRLAACANLDNQMTIYLGDEAQLPDPLIESFEGTGEVSANRGIAYVVFERRDVTDFGGRPAQYQFEVTRADIVRTPTTELESDALYPWDGSARNAENPLNDHEYQYDPPGAAPVGAWADLGTVLVEASTDEGYTISPTAMGWHNGVDGVGPYDTSASPGERETLSVLYQGATDMAYLDEAHVYGNGEFTPGGSYCGEFFSSGIPLNTMGWMSIGMGLLPGTSPGGLIYAYKSSVGVVDPVPTTGVNGWLALNNCFDWGGTTSARGQPATLVAVRRVPVGPEIPGADLPDWPVDPEDYTWNEETGEIFSKEPWSEVAGDYLWLSTYVVDTGVVIRYPLGPVLHVDDPNNTPEFWLAAKTAAELDGYTVGATYQGDGLGDEDTYPRYSGRAWQRSYTAITYADYDGTTVGAIVRDQCERSRLVNDTDFDVSNLTQIIPGYKVERVMNGRDIIAPLRQYALFDGLETDKIRFPLRGGDVVATLTDDDLGAHEPGSSPPAVVDANRIEDVELPYAIRVRYAELDNEYQPGSQLATWKVKAGNDAQDVETTIAMGATKAVQMAEVLLQESLIRREPYGLSIGPHMLALTATDPIYIPLRGELQRAMIMEDTRALPGIIEAKAVRDDQSVYVSTATGVPGGAGEQTLTPIGDTDLVIIDGPALSSSSNDAGVFLAACGASDRWRGYGLFESTDGGSNFSRIGAYTLPSTMGTLIDAIPEGPFEVWDYANSFTVAMDHGTLESRTQEEVTNGANAIFVGADGRWEVIQFCDAVPEGLDAEDRVIYRLSTLLRGRQGTEHAIGTSQVGDRLALCVTTNRLTMDVARVSVPRLFKAISFGRTSESGPEYNFTPQGVALKPYAPWLPEGQRDGSENLDIYAVRRTRIAAEWGDSDYVPLNEDLEAYEVDILTDGSPDTVVRTLSGSSFPIEYTAAQQTADFGSPQPSIRVRIYQISAAVGRGYPTEAIL